MSRLLTWSLRLAACLAVLLILIAGGLMTLVGQRVALSFASHISSSRDVAITIGRLEGSLFNSARINRISVADRDGIWLQLKDIKLTWSPLSLLRGHLNVEELLVASVELRRQPIAAAAATKSSSSVSAPLMRFTLGRLKMSDLILREAFVGTPAHFEVSARADLVDHRKGLTVNLAAKRLDRPGAKVQANLIYGGPNQNLSVNALASEPAGGLVAKLLQMPQQPPLALEFTGDGPLNAWQANWSIKASAQPFVAGRIRLDEDGQRHRLVSDFAGYVQAIAPSSLSGLLADKVTGSLISHFTGLERVDLSHLQLTTDALDLRAQGGFERATSYAHGTLSLTVGRSDQSPVKIALSNGEPLSIKKLTAKLSLPDQRAARSVSLNLMAEDLTHSRAAVSTISLTSRAKQDQPSGPNALDAEDLDVELVTSGFTSPIHGLSEALGKRLQLHMTGAFKSGVLSIKRFSLGDEILRLVGDGVISAERQSGKGRLSISDIGRFSALFGETLVGNVDLKSTMSANLQQGGFEISVTGTAGNLSLGKGPAAGLLGKDLKLSGEVARDNAGGIALRNFVATGNNFEAKAAGRFGRKSIELDHTIKVADLSAIRPDLAGAATLELKLNGTPAALTSTLQGTTQMMSWRGHAVEDFALRFSGKGPSDAHRGQFELVSRIADRPLVAKALLTLDHKSSFHARGVALQVGRNTLTGHVRMASNSLPSGQLILQALHLSDLDVFVGQNISGSLSGEFEILGDPQRSLLRLSATAPRLSFAGNVLKQFKATASLKDLTTNINGQASITLSELKATNAMVRNVSLDLRDRDGRLAFVGNGQINKAAVNVAGSIKQKRDVLDVLIDRADITREALRVRLAERAQLAIAGGGVRIQRFGLLAERGRIVVSGEANSKALQLEANLARVPASIANVFMPALGLNGDISGRVRASGSPESPIATIDATWKQATAQVLGDNHMPPVTIKLDGDLRDDNLRAKIGVQGPQEFALSVDGGVTLKPAQDMRFKISGNVPLRLANAALAARATQFTGDAKISGIVVGRPSEPKIDIKIDIPDATVHDPSSGVKLQRVVGLLQITERGLEVRNFTGQSELGGTVSVTGTLARADQSVPELRLTTQLSKFRFNDRKIMAGDVDGVLTLAGPLDALTARGNVYLRRLDVMVPAAAPRSLTTLNVKHINAPQRLSQAEGRKSQPQPATSAPKTPILLDLRLEAANRIFVKGRGVDAQLGGSLTIRGTSDAPVTDGAFTMQRGRLDILGRRLDFQRGQILFDGAPEPILDMEAATVAGDATIIVTISGQASQPVFKFSSNPELPEDEVIARLLFNKDLVGLSPLQLVHLASEVDKLGGLSSGPNIVDKLKRSVGVDVLDVSTDKTGAATVSAGRYVTDKTFVGVKQGATAGSSRVIIDHDFTKNLKARGEVGTSGNSKLGIGLEWDY